jgi:hypothetical protein
MDKPAMKSGDRFMNNRWHAVLYLFLASVLFPLSGFAETPLDKEQAISLVSGARAEWAKPMKVKGIEGTVGGHRQVTTHFLADGSFKETWAAYGRRSLSHETGEWWVEDDGRLCMKKKERGKCSFLVPAEDGGYDFYEKYTEHEQLKKNRRFDKISRQR